MLKVNLHRRPCKGYCTEPVRLSEVRKTDPRFSSAAGFVETLFGNRLRNDPWVVFRDSPTCLMESTNRMVIRFGARPDSIVHEIVHSEDMRRHGWIEENDWAPPDIGGLSYYLGLIMYPRNSMYLEGRASFAGAFYREKTGAVVPGAELGAMEFFKSAAIGLAAGVLICECPVLAPVPFYPYLRKAPEYLADLAIYRPFMMAMAKASISVGGPVDVFRATAGFIPTVHEMISRKRLERRLGAVEDGPGTRATL